MKYLYKCIIIYILNSMLLVQAQKQIEFNNILSDEKLVSVQVSLPIIYDNTINLRTKERILFLNNLAELYDSGSGILFITPNDGSVASEKNTNYFLWNDTTLFQCKVYTIGFDEFVEIAVFKKNILKKSIDIISDFITFEYQQGVDGEKLKHIHILNKYLIVLSFEKSNKLLYIHNNTIKIY